MSDQAPKTIAIIGATGLQGSALSRRLLEDGWHVRAVTRDPGTDRARVLANAGAQLVTADSLDPTSLDRAFDGVQGVYSVQNHHLSGYDGETRQGNNVADAAKRLSPIQASSSAWMSCWQAMFDRLQNAGRLGAL